MALGFAFVRPQSAQAAPGNDQFRAFELAGDFIDSLLKDPAGARAVGIALGEAGQELLPRFLASRQEPLRKAEGRIRQIFRPFADVLNNFLAAMGRGIPDTLPAALSGLKGLVALMRADSATRILRELIHLARTDLEVTPEAVEALFRSFIDGAVGRLQARVLGGDMSEEALNRYEWGVNLKSLELLLLEELDWPSLDLEIMVDALQDLYRRTGFEDLLGKFERVLDSAADVAEPLGKILDQVLAPPATGGGSVGAAGDMPPVAAGDPISQYASWVLQRTAHFDVKEDTVSITPIAWITYKHVSPHAMEQLAIHTRWISDLAGMLFHIISAEKGDMASNILQMFWDGTDLVATLAKERIPNWAQWVFTPLISIIGGFEGFRCEPYDKMYPLTLMLGDGGETLLYRRWRWLFRESLLSFVTLLNHDTGTKARWEAAGSPTRLQYDRGTERVDFPVAFNNDQFQGVCYVFGEIGTLLLPAILSKTDRMNYGFIGGGPTGHMVGRAFGGMAISWVMNYLSLFLCKLTAGDYPQDGWAMVLLPLRERYIEKPDGDGGTAVRVVHGIVVGGLIEWVMQVIYLYLFTNGNTSDGRFPAQDKQDIEYNGYDPAPAASPYKLPWASPTEQECVQNPMGIWSHYPDDGQAYAYDFSHNAGTEVLCSRSGLVTFIEQDKLNNNTAEWNNIEVMSLKTHPAGTAGTMPGVEPPPRITTFKNGTPIAAGTKFPPYWDVTGRVWPMLPPTLPADPAATPPFAGDPVDVPLHPSGAILPGTPPPAGGLPADTRFTMMDPEHDRAYGAVSYAPGSKFADGTTAIPAGVVFAPDAPRPPALWSPMYRAGTVFVAARRNFQSAPYPIAAGTPPVLPGPPAVAGFTPAAAATFLDDVAIPAGVILPPDANLTPAWLPKPHPVTPMYLPGTMFKRVTDTEWFNAGTDFVPVDTPFPAIPPRDASFEASLNHQWMTPMVATFCRYGHALAGFASVQNHTFVPPVAPATAGTVVPLVPPATRTAIPGQPREDLTDVFGTSNNDQILGRYVEQGRVIMLSGDTGISAYNHLHTHVSPFANKAVFRKDRWDLTWRAFGWMATLPFSYADAVHNADHGFREAFARDGVPRAMTTYISQNNRTGP